jgi:hypothetical protein
MAIDITQEKLISLLEARGVFPGRPSLCTLWRWRLRGVKGRKLESVALGGRIYTSLEAIERFARHQQGSTDAPQIRTPAARERAIRKAEQELADAGI